MNDKAGLSSLGLPTGLGGAGGGLAAMAAASTLSRSATPEPEWGLGGYIALRAARRPLSASSMCNPHQKVLFACLGRGGPWGGPGRVSG